MDGTHAFQLRRIGLLKVHRVQRHHAVDRLIQKGAVVRDNQGSTGDCILNEMIRDLMETKKDVERANSREIPIITNKTPASAGASGVKGEIAWDSSYLYVCVADDTWKRVAISTW